MLDPTADENLEYLTNLVKVMISAILILFVILEMSLFVMSYTITNLVILIGGSLFLMFIVLWYMGKINFRFR